MLLGESRGLAVALTGLTLAACGGGVHYNVGVNTFSKAQNLTLDTTASVAAVAASGNALFAEEVAHKAEHLLAEKGYDIAPVEEADYLVFLAYGIGPPNRVSEGGVAMPLGNLVAYVPQSRTEYFRWLAVGVADAEPFHTEDLSETDIPWLWMAETTSTGSTSDLRQVIDYLLVPTLERFGENTGQRVSVRLEGDDPRVPILADSTSNDRPR